MIPFQLYRLHTEGYNEHVSWNVWTNLETECRCIVKACPSTCMEGLRKSKKISFNKSGDRAQNVTYGHEVTGLTKKSASFHLYAYNFEHSPHSSLTAYQKPLTENRACRSRTCGYVIAFTKIKRAFQGIPFVKNAKTQICVAFFFLRL
jgi:hypothetical protein